MVFDKTVFPFQELDPDAGARLQQEILLLLNHLLNSGDALPESNVTNDQPSSSTIAVLQEPEKKSDLKW